MKWGGGGGGNIPSGNFLGGNFPEGNFPGGSLMGGNFPRGEFSYNHFKQIMRYLSLFWEHLKDKNVFISINQKRHNTAEYT